MSKNRMELQPIATDDSGFRAGAGRLVEEGAAFMELAGLDPGAAPSSVTMREAMPDPDQPERFDVIVIGAGQAGLSVGHHLGKQGLSFVILDADRRVGDAWRRRWDSLRLFTPARFNGLDGMPFPGPAGSFPTKDEMADYLESYAARFKLPVRTGVRVDKLSKHDGRYVVQSGNLRFEADQVIIAMASYQRRRVPAFARDLASDIVQLHSSEYRNPGQLREGTALIAGAGNSGAEIARELARDRRTWMSGRDTGHVPFDIHGLPARLFLTRFLLRFVFHRVLTVKTPMGRKVRPKVLHQGTPLIRLKPRDLRAAGVERVGRVVGVRNGLPLLEDGRVLDVANVVWCTGYDPGFSWIDLPILDADGEPRHEGGIVGAEPGLYFVGLHFLYSMSSTMIHGVGRDAARIVEAAAGRVAAGRTARNHDRQARIRTS